MNRVLAIAGREFKAMFITPTGYVVVLLFVLFMGAMFAWRVHEGAVVQDSLQEFIGYSRFGLFFVVPLLTMGSFSEEYRSGRIEVLRTTQISEVGLLAGKFLGAMGFYMVLLLCLAPHLVAFKLSSKFISLPLTQLISCFVGMTLMGCMFVSVGIFFSSCTREQIVAGLLTFITLGALTVADLEELSKHVPEKWHFLNWEIPLRDQYLLMTVGKHISDLAKGSIDATGIPYFGILTLLFLFWTYVVMESKRWR